MAMQSAASSTLPSWILPLLWDVDAATIDPDGHRSFLIGRILAAGSLEAIRWARRTYGDDAIRAWIVALAGQMSIRRMLDCYQQRFGVADTSRLLARLCFFDDADADDARATCVGDGQARRAGNGASDRCRLTWLSPREAGLVGAAACRVACPAGRH